MTGARTFLVEAYAPASSELGALSDRARDAATPGRGTDGVTHVLTILVPDDEICLHLFEAVSADSVSTAIRRVDLHAQRIVEVIR